MREVRSVDVNGRVFSCIARALGPSVVDHESCVRHWDSPGHFLLSMPPLLYEEAAVGATVDEDEEVATESFLTTTDFSFNKLAALLLLVS